MVSGKQYLVTGGAGFIGSHISEALLAAGHRVRVLDDLSSGKHENLREGVEFMRCSITKRDNVEEAAEGMDGIFHLAAIASVPLCAERLADAHEVNLTGTLRLFEAAQSRRIPIVYTSSAAIYGNHPDIPLRESAVGHPLSAYGLDKLGCEEHAALLSESGLRSVGIRPFNVYGPRQDPSSSYSGVISIFCQRLREKSPITLLGDGGQTRDFIEVGDVAARFTGAMKHLEGNGASCVLNACTGHATSIRQLAETLMEIAGHAVEICIAPPRAGDVRHSSGDPSGAADTLGISSTLPLAEGLTRLWKSLK